MTQELLEQLKTLGINTVAAQTSAPQAGGLTWAQPVAAVAVSTWDQVLVPIKVDTAKGEVTVNLSFSGITTPEAVGNLVKMLADKGFPLKTNYIKNNGGFSAK